MTVAFRAASGGQSSTTANAASVTKPTGTLTGDLVIAGLTVKDAQTFTAQAGWTLEQNANSGGNVSTTATYRRVLDGTESWPISFAWTGSAVKYAWVAAAFSPGAGNVMGVDGEASVKVDTTTATTHTANAQAAAAASVCSVIFNCHRNSSSGATGATVLPPTNWTEPANGDQTTASGTTTALSQLGIEVCYRTGQSGTVTPGSCTLSLTGTQNTYHFLLADYPVAHAVLATGTGAALNLVQQVRAVVATASGHALRPQEISPALELSGYGTFTGPGTSDTINSVTLTCNQFASAAALGPPVYELWDYSGTPAKIGSATGTASISASNIDTVLFTGVTYAMLGTLRVRIYGTQGSAITGAVQNINWAELTVSYTPASGTSVTAVLASGTGAALNASGRSSATVATGAGTALNPAAAAGVTAVAATGTGASLNANPPVPAVLASGTGAALNATAQTSGSATATAVVATGTGTAQSTAFPGAVLAAGTGTALNAAAAIGAGAIVATGTGAAQSTAFPRVTAATGTGAALNPAAAIGAGAVLATGTGAAQSTAFPGAVLASGTGAAQNATVSTVSSGTGAAVLATGAGAALNASPPVPVTVAAGAGAALNATASTSSTGSATAVLASGAGAALNASPPVPAVLASGTGTALNATVSTASFTNAHAVVATGTGAALNAATLIPVTLAGGAGAALNPGAAIGAKAIAATGTGTTGASLGAAAGLAAGTGTAQAAVLAIAANAAAAQALAAALAATAKGTPAFTVGTLTAATAAGSATAGTLTASDQRTGGPA